MTDPILRAVLTLIAVLVIIESLVWIFEYFGWITNSADYWRGR